MVTGMSEFSPSYQDRLPREIYVLPYEKNGTSEPVSIETDVEAMLASAGPETRRLHDIIAPDRKCEPQDGQTADQVMMNANGDAFDAVQTPVTKTPQAVAPEDPTPRKFTFDGISPISSGTIKIAATATTEESRDDRDEMGVEEGQEPSQADNAQPLKDTEKGPGDDDDDKNNGKNNSGKSNNGKSNTSASLPVSPSAARSPQEEDELSSKVLNKILVGSCMKDPCPDADKSNLGPILSPLGRDVDELAVKLVTEVPVFLASPFASPSQSNVAQRDQPNVAASECEAKSDETKSKMPALSPASWSKYFCGIDLDVLEPLRRCDFSEENLDGIGKQLGEASVRCDEVEIFESSGAKHCVELHLEWIQEEVAELMLDPKPVSSEDLKTDLQEHLFSTSHIDIYSNTVPECPTSADPFEDFERNHYDLFLTESKLQQRTISQWSRDSSSETILEEEDAEKSDDREQQCSVLTDERTRRTSTLKETRSAVSTKDAVLSSPRKASFDSMTFNAVEELLAVEKKDDGTCTRLSSSLNTVEDKETTNKAPKGVPEEADRLDAFGVELDAIEKGETVLNDALVSLQSSDESPVKSAKESQGVSMLQLDHTMLDSASLNAPILSEDAYDDRICDIIVAEAAPPRAIISLAADETRPKTTASEVHDEAKRDPCPPTAEVEAPTEPATVPNLESSGRRLEDILDTVSTAEEFRTSSVLGNTSSCSSIKRYSKTHQQQMCEKETGIAKAEDPEGETAATELSSDGDSSSENVGSQTRLAWQTPVTPDILYALEIDAAPSDELRSHRMVVPATANLAAPETAVHLAPRGTVTISTIGTATATRTHDPSYLFCEGFESLIEMCSTPVSQAKTGLGALWHL